ncbi:hypothetical protein N9B10_04010 [Pirellulales bacterium]|nr:hypothetical protein [Pirellulales bacterium]
MTKVPLGNCRETVKRCPFPSDDVEAGLNYLSPVLQDMFVVMDCTAARSSEVCRLALDEISNENVIVCDRGIMATWCVQDR